MSDKENHDDKAVNESHIDIQLQNFEKDGDDSISKDKNSKDKNSKECNKNSKEQNIYQSNNKVESCTENMPYLKQSSIKNSSGCECCRLF